MKSTQLDVIQSALSFIPEEMGVALRRTAYSPNIKERMDASCALFDADGTLAAQAEHIPVHLGSMPLAVRVAMSDFHESLVNGDQVILNNPYRGGTHLPDITLIKPVFEETRLLAYTVNRAHHADIGGIAPGSMPADSHTLEDEGLVLDPQLALRRGVESRSLFERVRRSTLNPAERIGDLRAQIAANELGARRVLEYVERHGAGSFQGAVTALLEYSERRMRSSIRKLPRGTWTATEFLEAPGRGHDYLAVRARATVRGTDVFVDFEGSDGQTEDNLNAPLAVTLSAVYYVLRCLTDPEIPANEGVYRPIRVSAPEASIVNAREPAAVAAGNVETSQRIVDTLFSAFAIPLPDRVPAQSQGTMNNVTIGSRRLPRFSYYETIAGGEGALPDRAGMHGVHTHMTNTKNTPAEALELSYPLRVEEYRLIPHSGGAGAFRGGDGIRRAVRVLARTATVSIISDRRRLSPRGLHGGLDGRPGRNLVVRAKKTRPLPAKFTSEFLRDDVIVIETPGGGGWGRPRRSSSKREA